jgi:hypothetical protein
MVIMAYQNDTNTKQRKNLLLTALKVLELLSKEVITSIIG